MLIATGTPVGVFTSTVVAMIMTPGGLFRRGIVRKKNLINFITWSFVAFATSREHVW